MIKNRNKKHVDEIRFPAEQIFYDFLVLRKSCHVTDIAFFMTPVWTARAVTTPYKKLISLTLSARKLML